MSKILGVFCQSFGKSFPFLRGNVNEVDKGEFRNIKINNNINNSISAPPSAKADTSPQSREEFKEEQSREGLLQLIQSSPSLRGRCPKDRGEANNKKFNQNNKIDNNISTPPPLRGTSPQSREEFIEKQNK